MGGFILPTGLHCTFVPVHKIKKAWCEKKVARAVVLDVSAEIDAIWHKGLLKNPAYGRQSISRPMRIVAPIPQ